MMDALRFADEIRESVESDFLCNSAQKKKMAIYYLSV